MADGVGKVAWPRVAFGDVVRLLKERSRHPEADGLERYVGLEHLEPGELKIRRWGDIANGTTFTTVFHPGQVLFGKRRAYQRKVAVPDFSGVCSGDIYVLEPKGDDLLPELLPFICQTDAFFDHAVGTSAGSLSPRTNWKSLATFEFALPPLEEQRRIAKVLQGRTKVEECTAQSLSCLNALMERFLADTYACLVERFELQSVESFGESTMGRQKSPKYRQGKSPFPYMRVANIGSLRLQLDEVQKMDFTQTELAKFRLTPGDILLTEGDLISQFNVGRPALFSGEITDCCFQNTLIRFRPGSDIAPLFALLLIEGARLNYVFAKAAKTTTVTHLGLGRFKDVALPLPDKATRDSLAEQFSELLQARSALDVRLGKAKEVSRMILSEVLT